MSTQMDQFEDRLLNVLQSELRAARVDAVGVPAARTSTPQARRRWALAGGTATLATAGLGASMFLASTPAAAYTLTTSADGALVISVEDSITEADSRRLQQDVARRGLPLEIVWLQPSCMPNFPVPGGPPHGATSGTQTSGTQTSAPETSAPETSAPERSDTAPSVDVEEFPTADGQPPDDLASGFQMAIRLDAIAKGTRKILAVGHPAGQPDGTVWLNGVAKDGEPSPDMCKQAMEESNKLAQAPVLDARSDPEPGPADPVPQPPATRPTGAPAAP